MYKPEKLTITPPLLFKNIRSPRNNASAKKRRWKKLAQATFFSPVSHPLPRRKAHLFPGLKKDSGLPTNNKWKLSQLRISTIVMRWRSCLQDFRLEPDWKYWKWNSLRKHLALQLIAAQLIVQTVLQNLVKAKDRWDFQKKEEAILLAHMRYKRKEFKWSYLTSRIKDKPRSQLYLRMTNTRKLQKK